MDAFREISIITGVLYLLGFVAGIFSVARAVDDPEYLTKAANNSRAINIAACFQILLALIYLAIPIILYPLLIEFENVLTIGFLSFRILAVLFVMAGTIVLLQILKLSKKYTHVLSNEKSSFQTTGDLLKKRRDLINHVGMVFMLSIGNILLNIHLITFDLIPDWLGIWGIIGAVFAILASLLVLLNRVEVISHRYLVLNMPVVVQELVFSIWLIGVGFVQ